MKLTQIIDDGAARTNELFAKLAETSPGAVKTREKLITEVRQELERLMRLDQEHLFPVLRKNQATRDLARDAAKDNEAILKMAREMEEMPKDGEGFSQKLADMRKAFQRSIRDDKKQLLPAIRKVLSAEDEQALADRMSGSRPRAGEEEKQLRQVASEQEKLRRQAIGETRERIAQTGTELGRAAEGSAALAGQAMATASEGMDLASHLPRVAADVFGETGRLLSDLTSRAVESGQRASRDIAQCGTPLQAAVVQARLVREMTDVWMDTGSRMVEISMRASQEAILPLAGRRDQ
jgi:hypothetical protein